MSGVLYCVGLGPGDPELITRKAARIIGEARVVFFPAPEGGSSFARSIAAELFHPDVEEHPVPIPMDEEQFAALVAYGEAAESIGRFLTRGQDVVVLCQGDPFFYGSFIYLFERIDRRFRIEVVPGVTSMTACSAAALQPLCGRREIMTILPALLPEDDLADRLASPDPFVIVKIGRHAGKLKRALARSGRIDTARYISHASLGNQRILPLVEAPDVAPYFSTVIVPGSGLLEIC